MASKTTHSRPPEHAASIHIGVMTTNSEAAIWTRFIQPERDDLSARLAASERDVRILPSPPSIVVDSV
jgi:hypothetical protein